MADLLSSLITLNKYNSSQDSFHSFTSQPDSHISMTEADTDSIDAQAPPLQLCGVKDYLDANVASINQNGKGKGSQSQSTKRAQQSSSIGEPVSLGSKTSHYVSALNTLCQAKGFVPVFVIDDDASLANFGGVLKLGDVTVTSEQRWHSKKEAREGLAKKGLDAVRDMAPGQKMSTQGEGDEKNWIGLLLGMHLIRRKKGQHSNHCNHQSTTTSKTQPKDLATSSSVSASNLLLTAAHVLHPTSPTRSSAPVTQPTRAEKPLERTQPGKQSSI